MLTLPTLQSINHVIKSYVSKDFNDNWNISIEKSVSSDTNSGHKLFDRAKLHAINSEDQSLGPRFSLCYTDATLRNDTFDTQISFSIKGHSSETIKCTIEGVEVCNSILRTGIFLSFHQSQICV